MERILLSFGHGYSARALARLAPERLAAMLDVSAPEEGWILGLGFEDELQAAARAG